MSGLIEPWLIHFFQRARHDDPERRVPAIDFLEALPTAVAAEIHAGLDAVAAAVGTHDGVDDPETQAAAARGARTRRVGPVEPFQHVGERVRRPARPYSGRLAPPNVVWRAFIQLVQTPVTWRMPRTTSDRPPITMNAR